MQTVSRGAKPDRLLRSSLAPFALPFFLIWAYLMVDQVPRFMQGDSVSYLRTGTGWIPPDRSWAYGYGVHALLQFTHGYASYLLLNALLLTGAIVLFRRLFGQGRGSVIPFAIAVAAIAADPMTALYGRFYMSDFWAAMLIAALQPAMAGFLRGGRRSRWLLPVIAVPVAGAVFCRVAYAPILLLSSAILLVWTFVRAQRRARVRAALLLVLPLLSVGTLAGCNAVLFAKLFGPQSFVNKLSGTFLLGVFAPVLNQKDFAAAGVPVSDQEYWDLRLWDYDRRGQQVWGDHFSARLLIMDRLGDHAEYSGAVDQKCLAVVKAAFRRKPAAFAGALLHGLVLYFEPAEWQKFVMEETGVTRPLETPFVDYFNSLSVARIYPQIVVEPSLSLTLYRAVIGAYPIFLGLCSLVALILLLARGSGPAEAVVAANFLATLLVAPLYSNFVIPRYLMASVLLGYILLGQAFQQLLQFVTVPLATQRAQDAPQLNTRRFRQLQVNR